MEQGTSVQIWAQVPGIPALCQGW